MSNTPKQEFYGIIFVSRNDVLTELNNPEVSKEDITDYVMEGIADSMHSFYNPDDFFDNLHQAVKIVLPKLIKEKE